MQEPMEFAVVGLAVVGSISIAVVVEWIGLWGLMKMMPDPEPATAPVSLSAAVSNENVPNPHAESVDSLHSTARAASAP
jgi:hypothetical protein